MNWLDSIIEKLPEVTPPTEKKRSFTQKLRWTGIILGLYFILALVPLQGLGENALANFQFLSTILGASFGSLVSLGIGPIVTASIVLQLLNGSGIINFDTTTSTGKKRFQGTQKILAVFFTFIEAIIFVILGGFIPAPGIPAWVLVLQLFIGGIFIILMDEMSNKYGFGSGVSLFIAAGVSQEIFVQLFSFQTSDGGVYIGAVLALIQGITQASAENVQLIATTSAKLIATIVIFFIVVYAQAMKVEIPLSFGRVKGHGVRWPLNFLYSNVIPIILVAALLANIQLMARFLESTRFNFLGTFDGQVPVSGLAYWINPPQLLENIVLGVTQADMFGQALSYIAIFVIGSTIFSVFWVQTSGLDARAQAKQMVASGLQVPGFRRDTRVLEKLLQRYIWPLSILGGIAIGLLASVADLTGAIGTGTGLLLTVMIVYKLYEDIAKQHMYDMNPMLRKFMQR